MSDDVIEIEGQQLSLAEIANIDIAGVEAVYGAVLPPEGVYQLRLDGLETSIESSYDEDKDTKALRVTIAHTIRHVHSLNDKSIDPSTLIGESLDKRIQDDDLKTCLGKVVAHLQSAGVQMPTPFALGTAATAIAGQEFNIKLTHGTIRGTDQKFLQWDLKNAKPVGATPVATAAPAAAAPAPEQPAAAPGITIGQAAAG